LAADRGRHPYIQKNKRPLPGGIEISACLFVFPLMRVWTGISYFVFHGKAKAGAGDYQQQADVA